MFTIAHDNQFVYSIIEVKNIKTRNWFDKSIEDLMFLWANQTAIPYLNWMKQFITDDTVWYLK